MGELTIEAQRVIDQARKNLVDLAVNPLFDGLPIWVESLRPWQISAVKEIVEGFKAGNKVMVLDAPTGTGKTLIGELVRRMLDTRAVYVCNTKGLQDQFCGDFDYANLLKGRANYPTGSYPKRFHPDTPWSSLSTQDCNARKGDPYSCSWCPVKFDCPYELAKKAALRELGVLNTAYWLTEVNRVGKFKNRGLVIFDEADTLESQLMGHVSIDITAKRVEEFGFGVPDKITVSDAWIAWLDRCENICEEALELIDPETDDLYEIRRGRYLVNLYDKLELVKQGIPTGAWVYTGSNGAVSFKPSRVNQLGEAYIWQHDKRFLLMSATVISASEMMDSLGYQGKYGVVTVPSSFPKENRPVVIKPVADMSHKVNEREKLAHVVTELIARHPNERVLVHTVSYDLTSYVADSVRMRFPMRKCITYRSSGEKNSALQEYRRTEAAILVAPSMDRGVDLPNDQCRVQIIAKIPFPNLGDKQINARLYSYGGNTWYAVQTVRTIVQMAGRAVRHSEDTAVTYIVDKQIERVWQQNRGMFPRWFKEAMVWE